ncbi:hypothetical protein G6F37_001259 [Rhizopus arrhizus]|nr:hypothetical protein G6F38_002459 [Rhizopus arrhizus]KAG1163393.1 hypothetical protein G6F37_001259 [Rhizopus arrhizus]
MPEIGLLDDKSRTQLNGFLSSYPEDYAFQKNSIYYDVMANPKTILKPSSDLLNCLKLNRQNSLLASRFAFKHQGFQKPLRFQGTLETYGVGVSIIKQNTDTSRKSPKPNTEKKVDGSQTEHIEGLGQADLKSTEGKSESNSVDLKKFVQYIKTRASVKNTLYEYYEKETTKSKEAYFPESEFDFRVDQNCNLYYGNLFIARIRGFFPQPGNYSTDSSVKSQLYPTYLQTMLQQKHISERLDDSEKSKVLGLAKEMCRRPQQSNYKKTISTALEKLQLLPFRKLKFSSKLFFDQNDQKLVRILKAEFGQDAVLVFGD